MQSVRASREMRVSIVNTNRPIVNASTLPDHYVVL